VKLRGPPAVLTGMWLRALLVTMLVVLPSAEAATPAHPPTDARAECMKACAGTPHGADGKHLLACLQQCQPPDAGVLPADEPGRK